MSLGQYKVIARVRPVLTDKLCDEEGKEGRADGCCASADPVVMEGCEG